MQRLTQTLDFQANALVLRAERQRLLASNIANADTPGFVAREMDFASALRRATGASEPGGAAPMAATHAAHFGAGGAGIAGAGVTPAAWPGGRSAVAEAPDAGAPGEADDDTLVYARHAQDAIDRNTVDLDRERASFADNTLRYEAALRFLGGSVRTLADAMKPPSQG